MAYGRKKSGSGKSVFEHGYNWWSDVIPKRTQDKINQVYSGNNNSSNDMSTRSGNQTAGIQLSVATPDGDYLCQTSEVYKEKASIVQEVDSTDAGITLSSFSKVIGALTVHNAKAIIVKNVGTTALEIITKHPDWREDSDGTETDIFNNVDMNVENDAGEETDMRFQSEILPVGKFKFIPNSRIIGYQPLAATLAESAANADAGAVAIEPKSIASGAEIIPIHLFAGTTYNSGADVQLTADMAIDATTVAVDDGDYR